MSEFDDIQVKDTNTIYGSTIINHAKRIQMDLSMAEYCVADFIEYANGKRKLVTYEYAYRRLGLKKELFIPLMTSLRNKGYITDEQNNIKVTRKWLDTFMVGAEWFDAFWNIRGKPYWPGSKKDAQKKFEKACYQYSPEFIIQCRDNYVKFMNHPANKFRQIMMATVFLNPETERFKEDWLGQLKRLNGKDLMEPRKVTILTAEEKKQLFS